MKGGAFVIKKSWQAMETPKSDSYIQYWTGKGWNTDMTKAFVFWDRNEAEQQQLIMGMNGTTIDPIVADM